MNVLLLMVKGNINMWIKRSEWIQILTNSSEHRVKAEMTQTMLESLRESMSKMNTSYQLQKEKLLTAIKRIAELENKILELNDALNIARKAAVPLASLNVAEMFDDEDPVKVSELRERIRAEGADIVLAETMES